MKKPAQILPLAVSILALIPAAQGGTIWDGGGADDLWGSGGNWNDDFAPVPGVLVDLTFDGVTRLGPVNNYTAFDDFHSLTFAATAGAFTLTGSALDLFGKIENYSAVTQTVSMDLAIQGGQAGTGEFNPVNGDLVINSANVFTNGNTLHVYGVAGKTVTFGSGTVISGSGAFNVEQASNAVFLGANTYTGTTNVLAGSLSVGNGGTTGTLGTGTVTVASGATLIFNRSDATTVANTLNIGGALVKNGAGTLTIAGAQTGITGTVSINAGRITMGADNALGTAATTLNGGALERNVAAATVANSLAIAAGGGTVFGRQIVDDYTTFSGQWTGSGALTVRGLVLLNNTTNTFNGPITISNASATYLRLAASEVLGNATSINVSGSGANLRLDGGVTETIAGISGSGTIFVSKVGAATAGNLRVGSGDVSSTFTGNISNNDGAFTLTKIGTGTLTLGLTGTNAIASIVASQGTITTTNSVLGGAPVTLGDAGTGASNVAFLTSGGTVSVPIVVTANGTGTATIGSSGGTNPFFSGQITLNRATTFTAAASDRTTYTGKITGAAGTLTITGAARTVFESAAGLNDFTGDLLITGTNATLQIGAGTLTGENIPNTASVTVAGGAFLKLANNANSTETINALNGTGTVRRHEGLTGLQTLVLGANGGSGSFGGVLENGGGSLAIVKTGAGTQTITSTSGNTASGGITVNGGVLKFTGAAGFDSGTFGTAQTYTVNSGGTLEISGDWLTKSTSTYTINDGGTLAFTKTTGDTSLSYVNNLNLTDASVTGPGTYRVGNNTTATHNFSGNLGSVISSGFGMVKNGATQTVNLNVADGTADSDLTVSGVIYDVTGLTGSTLRKTGLGRLVLSAANTYSGPTVVSAGTIEVRNNAALAGSAVTLGDASTGADPVSLLVANSRDVGNAITVSALGTGTATIGTVGAGLVNDATTLSGTITLNRAATFTSTVTDRLALDGRVTGAVGTLTFSGGGRTSLSNTANDFAGNIVITGAGTILQASAAGAAEVIPNSSSVTVASGAVLQLASGSGAETIDALSGAGTVRTFSGGTFGSTLAVGSAGGSGTFSGTLTNGAGSNPLSLTKLGAGTQTLTGTNTYTGSTTVTNGTLAAAGAGALGGTGSIAINSGGTLLLGGADLNRVNDAAAITLAGGTFNTAGFSETVGTLTLTANSIIDMSTGASTLRFADSSALAGAWTGTLSIYNWTEGSDHLFFGNGSGAGLMQSQLDQIKFYSDAGVTVLPFAPGITGFSGGLGEIVPVPEPSAVGAALLAGALAMWRERRRERAVRAASRRALVV